MTVIRVSVRVSGVFTVWIKVMVRRVRFRFRVMVMNIVSLMVHITLMFWPCRNKRNGQLVVRAGCNGSSQASPLGSVEPSQQQ